jgi:hypothetical protein
MGRRLPGVGGLSIVTPRKSATVTSCSRSRSTHRPALNRVRITARPPAISAGTS